MVESENGVMDYESNINMSALGQSSGVLYGEEDHRVVYVRVSGGSSWAMKLV